MSRVWRTPGLAALLAGSGLWAGLYLGRVGYSGRFVYGFLLWNLFLAWVPWLLSLPVAWAITHRRRSVGIVALLAWVAFLPNAPYVITDFLHLTVRSPVPLWYDVLLLGTASITGLLAGAFSLRRVEESLDGRVHPWLLQAGVWVVILASGFGIYLGRFERWNSWDVLVHPMSLGQSLLNMPTPRAAVVTAACAGLLGVAYLAVRHQGRGWVNDPESGRD
ncbi:MAG: DUF1361 domain-containing protein [Sandaracinaceae bacterium]|nr:DUF1361 domain-containing protein [Sandaracinaceae bacterium]